MNVQKSSAQDYSMLTSTDCLSKVKEIAETKGKQALVQFFSGEQFYQEVQRIIRSATVNTDPQLKSQTQNFVKNISALSKDETAFNAFSEAYSTSKWTRWSVSDAYNSKKMYDSNFIDQAKSAFIMDLNFGGARKMIEMMAQNGPIDRQALREDFEHAKTIENQITTDQLNPSQKSAYSHLESFLKSGSIDDWESFNLAVKETGVSSMVDLFRTKEIRNKFEETLMQGDEGIDRVIGVLVSKDGREIIKEVMKTPEGLNLVGYLWNTPEGKVFVKRMLAGKKALDGWVTVAQIIRSQLNSKGRNVAAPLEKLNDPQTEDSNANEPKLYDTTSHISNANKNKLTISKEAQIEFVEKSRAEQVHLEELNKLLASAKDDADREYMATEINKLVATLFYEVKNFKSGFSPENQKELSSILSGVNADMDSTAQKVGLEIEMKKVPNASAKHITSLLSDESTASLYSIAIKNMHEEIRLFAKEELKVDPDDFMIRFVEFEKRMNENRRILRGLMRPIPNNLQGTGEAQMPQYSV